MKKQTRRKTLFIGFISVLIALGSIGAFAINKSPTARLLIRDAVVTTVASHMTGEEGFLFNLEYTDFMVNNPMTYSNSLWVLDYSQIIVPFFASENIREIPVYPKGIVVEPKGKLEVINVAGCAYYEERLVYIFVGEQSDARYLLPVLIHEHVHLQGGRFIDSVPPWLNVVVSEANTQAATIEILAAMCHSGDDLACTAFWNETKHYSSSAFWVRLQQNNLEEWYLPIARLLWPGHIDFEQASTKLIYVYLQYPWEQVIVPGILGEPLDTGNLYDYEVSEGNFVCRRLLMSFDDTEDLLGWLNEFIRWITPD